MRVAIVESHHSPEEVSRVGVNRNLSCFVRAMTDLDSDLDVRIIYCLFGKDKAKRDAAVRSGPVIDVYGGHPGLVSLPGFGPRRKIEKVIDELNPDVINVRGLSLFLDGSRYPAVFTLHGAAEIDALFRGHAFLKARSWWLSKRMNAARARYRHFIAISGHTYRWLKDHVQGRFYFIPNPVDEVFFDVNRGETGPDILFCGSIFFRKNLHGVIEAIKILRELGVECRLRIAGRRGDDPVYECRLEEMIDKYHLQEDVQFLGYLGTNDLVEEMGRSRCLVLPSFVENAPIVLGEACAAGLPSVASSAGGAGEIVTDSCSGIIVDPGSPGSIASGLRAMLENRDLADRFGEQARNRAQAFRPEIVAEKTISVYRSVIKEWGRRKVK